MSPEGAFPQFFDQAPRLRVVDGLAELLGAASGGLIEYGYADAVKLAGHSCPTVAGAYLLARRALLTLWPDTPPRRGEILVDLAAAQEQGVTGVIGAVFGLLSGAAGSGGFAGLGGGHVRRGLLRYGADLPLEFRFTRLDNGATVDCALKLSGVPAPAGLAPLLAACVAGNADAAQRAQFAALWQERVRCLLLEHADDAEVLIVRSAA